MFPFYDYDSHCIFIPGRGEQSIYFYAFGEGNISKLNDEYKMPISPKSFGMLEKCFVDYENCEMTRLLRWDNNALGMTSLRVLRQNGFDPDLYPAYRKQAGYAIGQAHSYIDNGIAQSWDDVIAMTEHKTNDDQKLPGQYFITDFDGNGIIDDDDNIPYGFTGTPQNTYNATVGVEYKGWSLMLQFYGATNVSRLVEFNSFSKPTLDVVFDEGSFWNPESGSGIPTPRYNSTPNFYAGTRFMYDGSFCRLKNMEIAYTWTKGWVKSLGLNNLKLYVNGNNLLLWTKMPDDRESNFAATGLASQGAYPTMKRINFGVKFEL